MHLHHSTHIFSFLICLITYITHVSFEALKSEFAVVLVDDATSRGIRGITIGPIEFSAKNLSNNIWFAYIVPTPVSGP